MKPSHAAVFAIVVALALLIVTSRGRGQDHPHHHPLHQEFYRTWKQPGSEMSCCNARITVDGVERGDCEPTEAKPGVGADGKVHWFARLPKRGPFIEIPDAKILRERNPEQGGQNGQLCWTPGGGVACFVPPDSGG